jgi:hypothetical protein
VDKFRQDHNAGETDDCVEARRNLLASQCHTLEAVQFFHYLFDPGACSAEEFQKELRPILDIGPIWNDRNNAALAVGGSVRL